MNWTSQDIILFNMGADSSTSAIKTLGDLLFEKGYVHDTFTKAVLNREKEFPTGLPTPEIQVAIPHADVEHVLKQAIAIGILKDPVEFMEMGSVDRTVMVKIIFMLAIQESDTLVSLLKNLVGILQDPEFLRTLVITEQPEQIARLFNQQLPP